MDFFQFISEQWLLVSLLVVLIYAFAFTERAKAGKPTGVHEVTRMLNQQQAVIVDVRDKDEFAGGHIVDAINIPHGQLKERLAELNKHKDKTLIIADKIGQHAGTAGRLLRGEGFEVRRLEGGMTEWTSQQLPLVK